MFDLDADPQAIAAALSVDPRLAPLLAQASRAAPAQRLGRLRDRGARDHRPAGQRRRRAHAVAARLAQRFGQPLPQAVRARAGASVPDPGGAGRCRPGRDRPDPRARRNRAHGGARVAGRPRRLPRRTHARRFRRALGGAARDRAVDRAVHRPARARPSRCIPGRGPGAAARGAGRRFAPEREGAVRTRAGLAAVARLCGDPAVARLDGAPLPAATTPARKATARPHASQRSTAGATP